jgi:hypothetical protein
MIKSWLRSIFVEAIKEEREERNGSSSVSRRSLLGMDEDHVEKAKPVVRIGLMEAINGRLFEVSTYKSNPHGADWKTEYYVMDDSTPIAEQLTTVMLMKGLQK